jgi:hypothetical protein
MGVLRAIVGALALADVLMLATNFDAWFTERGFTPAWFAERWAGDVPRLNVLAGVTDSRTTALVFALGAVAAALTSLGLFSRASSILTFVAVASIDHRTPDILHSGDTLLRQLCFLVMLSPSGAAFSLDRFIARRRGLAPEQPAPVSLWPQRLVQIQVAVVYFTTVWHKMLGGTWRDGTATWYVPRLEEFDRFPGPPWMDDMPFVAFTTYATLAIEFALCSAVFYRPLRKWALIAGLLLHASIDYRFNIPLFAQIMVAGYVAFYEGHEVAGWWDRLRARLIKGARA